MSDFYVNQRLSLKMDLPTAREAVLAIFDRVRKEFPRMDRFERASGELALESSQEDEHPLWVSLRKTSLRSGVVNPTNPKEAYRLHRLVLETAPYFLSISPLDVDCVELVYGFDMAAGGNHDAIVFEALYGQGESHPLASLMSLPGATPSNVQPMLAMTLEGPEPVEAFFEVKTRNERGPRSPSAEGEGVISVYLTLRRVGSVRQIDDLLTIQTALAETGEEIVRTRVVPNLLMPIRQAIASSSS
ncbi:MAG: hypothetical protein ACKVS8_03105 [Phycisphaerales bacterium]